MQHAVWLTYSSRSLLSRYAWLPPSFAFFDRLRFLLSSPSRSSAPSSVRLPTSISSFSSDTAWTASFIFILSLFPFLFFTEAYSTTSLGPRPANVFFSSVSRCPLVASHLTSFRYGAYFLTLRY